MHGVQPALYGTITRNTGSVTIVARLVPYGTKAVAATNVGIPAMGVNALFPFSISNGSAHINTNNEVAVSNASLGNSTNQAGLSLITPQGNPYLKRLAQCFL